MKIINLEIELKKILFRCDSSSTIGLGHVKRCLVLAKRLKEYDKNLKIIFATQNLNGNINQEILKSGFSIYSIRDNSVEMLDYFVKGLQINKPLDIDGFVENYAKDKFSFSKEQSANFRKAG